MQYNLEKLIQQTIPFSSSIVQAEVGLLFLSYHLSYQRQHYFKHFGITIQQYNILRILRGQRGRPANINLLKERMLDKMSDASRLVERLVKNGYVSRKPNEIDKRNTDVYITEKGLNLLSQIDMDSESQASPFKQLQPDQLVQFNKLINDLLGHL